VQGDAIGGHVSDAAGGLSELDHMGNGDFPAELDRVNWGAFFFSGIWALWYGFWWWIALLVAAVAAGTNAGEVLIGLLGGSALVHFWVRVVCVCAVWGATVYLALNANRLVWESERDRLARTPTGLDEPILVGSYRKIQRRWVLAGLVTWAAIAIAALVQGSFASQAAMATEYLIAAAVSLRVVTGFNRLRQGPSGRTARSEHAR
jgi:hypothetical protein